MEHFYNNIDSENWFGYESLYSSMVSKFNDGSRFVEVGTWKGMSACFMAVEIINSGKNIQFDCVDTWEFFDWFVDINKSAYENLYETFLKNIEPVKNNIKIIRMISWEGASNYENESIDFAFIDAGHDYNSIKKDLISWLPKIKKGGVIAGHDYYHKPIFDAVHEVIGEKNIKPNGSCWVFEK
jgi:predicted O-methyltransferase YrrM